MDSGLVASLGPGTDGDRIADGRYRPDVVAGTARQIAGRRPAFAGEPGPKPAAFYAPALDHRLPDVPAADRHHRRPRRLSGVLFDLSVDAEQGADALHRAVEFQLPVVARRVPHGDGANRNLRAQRRVLQSTDRAHHRAPDQQSAGQRPAQVARHAAGAVGHPARFVVAGLVVAVRSHPLRLQLHS